MKLLAPAGNFDSLKVAIENGADEVYLGINEFNARNNIDGFTMDNLETAVDYAHLFNVKVLLAINILLPHPTKRSFVPKFLHCFFQKAIGVCGNVPKQ